MARGPLALVALVIVGFSAAPAGAAVDLRAVPPLVRDGEHFSIPVPVGDLNGDGFDDLGMTGAETTEGRLCPGQPPNRIEPYEPVPEYQPVVHVVAGGPALAPFGPDLPSGAWRLACPERPLLDPYDSGRSSVAGVGDVDGDGIGDLAVGEGSAAPGGRSGAGSVYLVLGRRDGVAGDLQQLGDHGIRIDGPREGARLGEAVWPVGDVDGDGGADVALGYVRTDARDDDAWRVAIVHGARRGEQIDLARPGPHVTLVAGLRPEPVLAAAGDVDGDGRGDVIVGEPAPRSERDRSTYTGRVRVLGGGFGAGETTIGALPTLMRVRGAPGDVLGTVVAPAGDVDRDGRADLLLGATPTDFDRVWFAPVRESVYVVRGRPGATVDLGRSAAGVRRIRGPLSAEDGFGRALVGVPDQNGDGVPELAIGSPSSTPACRAGAGAAYIVPGDRAFRSSPIERIVGAGEISGPGAGAGAGTSLAVTNASGPLSLAVVAGQDRLVATDPVLFTADPVRALGGLPREEPERCLHATPAPRSLERIRRTGTIRLRVHSDLGAGQAHTLRVTVAVAGAPAGRPSHLRVGAMWDLLDRHRLRRSIDLRGPATRTVTIALPARVVREVRSTPGALVGVALEQLHPRGATSAQVIGIGRTRLDVRAAT